MTQAEGPAEHQQAEDSEAGDFNIGSGEPIHRDKHLALGA